MNALDIGKILPDAYEAPLQARSRKSQDAVLETGERLFAENGYRGTSIADISDASGVSVGSLYHRFGDKEGLARVIIHNYVAETVAKIEILDLSRSVQGDLRGMLNFVAIQSLEVISTRLGVYRAAVRLSYTSPDVLEATGSLTGLIIDKALAVLDDYARDITAPDSRAAMVHSVQLIVTIALQTRLGAGPYFPRETDALGLLLTDACIGILRPDTQT